MKKTHFLVRSYFNCYVDVTINEFNFARKIAKLNKIPYEIEVDKQGSVNFVSLIPVYL